MGRDSFGDENEVVKARIAFIIILLAIAVLIFTGIKLFNKKGDAVDSQTKDLSKVVVDISQSDNQLDETVEGADNNNFEEQQNIETEAVETEEVEVNLENESEATNIEETQFAEDETVDPVEDVTEGVKQEISVLKTANENAAWTLGIDVSSHQGTIDWQTVHDAGIEFAMVRIGYRSIEAGNLVEDVNAKYNLQEATAKGIKTGAYFVSTAINEAEAKEEANFVLNIIAKYQITYPVAFDCERFESEKSRQYGMSVASRTACAKAFLDVIKGAGYEPMFYASKGTLENNRLWETSSLENAYKMWVSWYSATPFPEIQAPNYSGKCAMWQYTDNGIIAGVKKPLDINVAYFGYNENSKAHDETAPEAVQASVEATMTFNPVNEIVTAKDKTNLRDKPGQGADSTVMYVLQKGEYVTKTGSSPSGWCRVDFNGITLYAKESYLTSDVNASQNTVQPEVHETQTQSDNTGIKTVFTACDDYVTPKIEVNLRTLPSTTNPDAVVVACVKNGEVIHRTGRNNDVGWSRLEYNGQVVYCVTSYLNTVLQ